MVSSLTLYNESLDKGFGKWLQEILGKKRKVVGSPWPRRQSCDESGVSWVDVCEHNITPVSYIR